MKRISPHVLTSLLVCAAIIVGGQFFAGAQEAEEAAPATRHPTALIEVSQIFREHKRFREGLEKMKVEVDAAEKKLVEEGDKIREILAEAEALEGSEPLKEKLEVEVAERRARLQIKLESQKKEFMKREAVMYAQVDDEIRSAVADYCRARGITLVIRYNRFQIDEHSTREEVTASINRAVVFHDGIDITDEILKRINGVVERGDL